MTKVNKKANPRVVKASASPKEIRSDEDLHRDSRRSTRKPQVHQWLACASRSIKCHFCHTVGHIKPNCRKWLALSQNERYQQRNSHETKYQLIYDHLEDSVLAPRFCQYCSDTNCDGQICESPFDYNDYNEASVFFTQSLSQLVVNAKLDRPLDNSHAPQTEHMYYYNDDWGEQHEYGLEDQWE
jgi:hypothetical protein